MEKIAEIAAALQPLEAQIDDLQVYSYWNANPSPPSIDFYPGEPFQFGAGFGVGEKRVFFTIRARVALADDEAGQKLLLRMLDVGDPASVEAALAKNDTAWIGNDGAVSGYRQYLEGGDPASGATLLGCEWRVEAFL